MCYKKYVIVLLICFLLPLSSCSNFNKKFDDDMGNGDFGDSNGEHNHTYDGVWQYDETSHWQTATCEHADEKGYMATHTYAFRTIDNDGDIIYECTVCNYTKKEKSELCIICEEGTADCYVMNGSTITFSGMKENSVYSISGQFLGNILIDVDENLEFELELKGFSLYSSEVNPICITGGDKVTLTAKKDTVNYIYDTREAVSDEDDVAYKGAIHSDSDLDIGGKGTLYVTSQYNNGIHTKDDLKVKNLTLTVNCQDNALKGNDSVNIKGGKITLISKTGDGIKTKNSDISSKGKQRGSIIISECELTIYAACDGIDAAYNVEINEETTNIAIYTDKYSEYSEEVTNVSDKVYYIRFSNQNYKYSVKYYNSDDDYVWENATFYKSVFGDRGGNYYYYSFPVRSGYQKIQVFVYNSSQTQGQDTNYQTCTDLLTWNTSYDTLAISSRGYTWTNYSTTPNGFGSMGGHGGFGGGMQDGNTEKGDYSTKGIKADNEIIINDGTIVIKSYDDGIHANNDVELENGSTPEGNITINGGQISIYSNDDGIHADNMVKIQGGKITITHSYEGIEGDHIEISGGDISVIASDDGINGTATSGVAIAISGGTIYVYAGGDGLDSNSQTSYQGIIFSDGQTTIISNSGGNSAIDTERGYTYLGGSVLAIMPSNGMINEMTNCSNFSNVATKTNKSLTSGANLTVTVDNDVVMSVQMPCSLSAMILYLGSNSAKISIE